MLTVSQTAELLRTVDHVLILTHVRPDGDTVGCAAALCAGLRPPGQDGVSAAQPGADRTPPPPISAPTRPRRASSRTRWSPPTSPPWACSRRTPSPTPERVDLAIDHHPSFEHFGRANIVRPEAAACGELIYDILAAAGPHHAGDGPAAVCGACPPTPAASPTPTPPPSTHAGGGGADAHWHRLPHGQQGLFPHQEPQADAAGRRHAERLRVLRPGPGGGAVRCPCP